MYGQDSNWPWFSLVLGFAACMTAIPTAAADDGDLMEVLATGTGLDPDRAVQSAFGQAIEHAVGVLVDAETLVENETLVSERILTYSRGFVEKFEKVRTWEADGLHYARLRVLVRLDSLTEKLQAESVAVRHVPGELLYRQVVSDRAEEHDAAEMLRRSLADHTMAKLVTIEIVGKPEVVEQSDVSAKLQVTARLTRKKGEWAKFRRSFRGLLSKIGRRYHTFSTMEKRYRHGQTAYTWGFWPGAADPIKEHSRKGGTEFTVCLFRSMNHQQTKTDWEAFALPMSEFGPLFDVADRAYGIRFTLLDDQDRPIAEAFDDFGRAKRRGSLRHVCDGANWFQQCYFLGPLLWRTPYRDGGITYMSSYDAQHTFDLDLDDLRRVNRCVAAIEEIKE